MKHHGLPNLDELGRDLLDISPVRKVFLLALPFLLAGSYFWLASQQWWFAAVFASVLLSFFTYGSVSHDLVHGSFKLPKRTNAFFLSAIELLALRSGHAYRLAHLHHHKRYPNPDDVEGAASRMSFGRALIEGIIFQPKIWLWAYRNAPRKAVRAVLIGELLVSLAFVGAAAALLHYTFVPFLYAVLMGMGSWLIPLITAYIPHAPEKEGEVTQTRLFRGTVLSLIALEHLYHLEHHLYPAVPHSNWPALAKRLDPYFKKMGLTPIKLWF
jgi:beta-carotene hydroxylase